jgi:ribonuclease Z
VTDPPLESLDLVKIILRTSSKAFGYVSERFRASCSAPLSRQKQTSLGWLFGLVRVPYFYAQQLKMGKKGDDHKTNTSCHVQILGVGSDTGCTVPSVLLFFDRKRYLFNVGEGFQRFCVEHKIKMTKVSSVLSTRSTTHTLGGLPGMLLTMRDMTAGGLLAGQMGYDIHGPPGLKTASNAFKTFVSFKDLGLKIRELTADRKGLAAVCEAAVSNDSVSITPVLVWPDESHDQERCETSEIDGSNGAPEPQAKRARTEGVSNITEGPMSCYVCQLPEIPGKFLPQKAASLGVSRGPLYGKLQKGESVEAANGQMVHPQDVMEPSTPGPTVLVLDCPSVKFIDGLVEGMKAWQEDERKRERVALVVHLAAGDILRHQKYVDFVRSFPEPAQHILVSESMDDKTPIMKKSAMLHSKLQYLDPLAFRPLHHGLKEAGVAPGAFPDNCRAGNNMLKFVLRPVAKVGFNDEDCSTEGINHEAMVKHLLSSKPGIEQIAHAVHAFKVPVENSGAVPKIVSSKEGGNVRFTFLGTGAAIPSKYRNVTSILLQNGDSSILMDCGESSLGQLYKRFGHHATEGILRSLRFVWISHIHADHHMGLASIIGARSRVLGEQCEPLLVIGPKPLKKMLNLYSTLEPMKFSYVEASATEVQSGNDGQSVPAEGDADIAGLLNTAKFSMGIKRLESVRVEHCSHAFALVLESSDFDHSASTGWKIAFSGDTRPCARLNKAAEHATVLIHEATFEDTMLDEAEEKRHSTTGEAIAAGQDASAYITFLTHFSQRYPKIPVIDESFSSRVAVAFDLMTVSLNDLPRVPLLTPGIKLLFEEMEEKGGSANVNTLYA